MKLRYGNLLGASLLAIGVGLLILTFVLCYNYLLGVVTPTMPGEQSILASFGAMLGPIVLAGVRAVYLGLMVWIGSILLLRGINLLVAQLETTTTFPPIP